MTTACYPVTAPVRTTEPTFIQEPLTIPEAAAQVGVSANIPVYSDKLKELIVSARQQVERDTRVVCYTGSHTWKFSEWPGGDWFEIHKAQVTSITSITYVAPDGDTDTWTSTEYALDTNGVVPIVKLSYGYVWPSLRGDENGITVTFVAGYSTVVALPQKIKQAVLLCLHAQWKDWVGEDSKQQWTAYDGQLNLIDRPVYA